MSLSTGYTWSHKGHRFTGYSLAGISTSIAFPEADTCFDVAQGLPFQIGINNLLITHGHMDHASGLPYIIAQKAMTSQLPPNVYVPANLVKPLKELMRIWEAVEDHTYEYNVVPVEVGVDYPLKPPYFFRTFTTYHRVPSNGYTVFERKKKLKVEYQGLTREELVQIRREGKELDQHFSEPLVSFTGDTRIEFLDHPDVRNSRILFMEVTFWDQKKTVENARFWGHIHLDELLPRLPELKCEKIVLIHASARYNTRQLNDIMDARIPEHFKSRIELFPRPL